MIDLRDTINLRGLLRRRTRRPRAELVALVQNQVEFVDEWIAYHRTIGFDNITIYDNDSRDGTTERLAAWCRERWFSAMHWPTRKGQHLRHAAYADAVGLSRADFIGFFDINEFLVLHQHDHVGDWLSALPQHAGAVAINRRLFGYDRDGSGPVIERVNQRIGGGTMAEHLPRSIARKSCLVEARSNLPSVVGQIVAPDAVPVQRGPRNTTLSLHREIAQINRYGDIDAEEAEPFPDGEVVPFPALPAGRRAPPLAAAPEDRSAATMLERAARANGAVARPA